SETPMKRGTCCVLAAALLVVVGLSGRLLAEKDASPTIAEIMRKLNGGTNSMTRNLELDLKEEDPDWEAIQESTGEDAKLVPNLPKRTPRRGKKASWKKLAKGYFDTAQPRDAAARKKDRKTASAVIVRIKNACKACHSVHRPKE